MSVAAGTITIEFVATNKVSSKKLLEDFSDFFVKYGSVTLTNYNDEKVELQVHSHEFVYFDEESGDEEDGDGDDGKEIL